MYYDSFGWHTRQEYEDFARVYGYDIMQWPGYPVLPRDPRVPHGHLADPESRRRRPGTAEAAKRIDALRTGASRKDWQPY